MARKDIGTGWDRDNRNAINDNFKELYESGLDGTKALEKAEEAVKTANGTDEKATEALNKSNQAVETSQTSKEISDRADKLSKRTQKELSQAILEGDSSPLGGQLSVGSDGTIYDDPQERLVKENEKVTSQLADIATNVKTFGAIGDGIADDTVAIQNAIDDVASNGGGTVRFPTGVYLVSDNLNVTGDNIEFLGDGNGSHIKSTVDKTIFNSMEFNNLAWRRLRLTGVRTRPGQTGYGFGIQVGSANNVIVENCYFDNFLGKAVFYTGAEYHGAIMNNLPQGVHDGWIINNYIESCADGAMVYNDGRRIVVSGNTIKKSSNNAIYIDDSHRMDGTEIARETMEIVVTNNLIEDTIGSSGINLAGTSNTLVSNNIVSNGGQSTDPVNNVLGISVTSVQNDIQSTHNIIEGNTIVGNSNIGIYILGASHNVIRGNNLVNNSMNRATGNAASIQVQSNELEHILFEANGNIIENNQSIQNDPNSSLSPHVRIIDENCNDNVIRYNNFTGGVSYWYAVDDGTNTIKKENLMNNRFVDEGFADGTEKLPSISFLDDEATGFYRMTDGMVAFSGNGKRSFRFTDGYFMMEDGTDMLTGLTTGTRFATSPKQKMGFWGKTPIQRPSGMPDVAHDLDSTISLVNFIRKALFDIGLIEK